MTVQRTENRVDPAAAQPGVAAPADAVPEAISRYEELVDERLWASPPAKESRVEVAASTAKAAPAESPGREVASPSAPGMRAELQPPSMSIGRYEALVSERLWETQPASALPAWRRHSRKIVAAVLLVLVAALAVAAFFWRTPGTPDIAVRTPAKDRAINPPPVVAQEAPTHTLPRAPQSTVPAAPAAAPRASVERIEPPAPVTVRTPPVTHTQAAAAAAVAAPERATPRAPKPASNCSEAVSVLGLCGADKARGNAR